MIPVSYFNKVKDHFEGDVKRTIEWFKTPHSAFNGFTPMQLLATRRDRKVKKYIDETLVSNARVFY